MPIMEQAGGDVGPGAAPEMESRVPIRSLTGSKSSAQSTQESNGAPMSMHVDLRN